MIWQGKCSKCGEFVQGGSDEWHYVKIPDERKGEKVMCLNCLLWSDMEDKDGDTI